MKKVVSFISAFFLMISAVSVFAENVTLTSGKCGDDAYWSFDEKTNTLTISGTGDMYGYKWQHADSPAGYPSTLPVEKKPSPWDVYEDRIEALYIEEGITAVGEGILDDCETLKKVVLPESVTKIGAWAFRHCIALGEINFPKSLERIEESAFSGCKSLEKITLPENLEEICDYAFSDCTALAEIAWEESINLKYVDDSAFNGTPYYENEENWYQNGFYLGNCLCFVRNDKTGEFVIKDGTIRIGDSAFELSQYSKIYFPQGLQEIGFYAFASCCNIEEITIPESVTKIGSGVFSYCTNLKSVEIKGNVKKLEGRLFEKCKSLEYVILPASLEEIDEYTFYNCGELAEFYYRGNEEDWNSIKVNDGVEWHNNTWEECKESSLLRDVIVHFDGITIAVDGVKIATDTYPYIKNDRTMVPMRAIFEVLGAEVSWDNETRTAVGVMDGVEVKITIGENVLYKNGEAIQLDAPAEITNDRTMVPVRAISEAFDCTVNWNDETKTVEITN